MEKKRIGIFTGSLRKESFSRKISWAVSDVLSKSYQVEMIDIGNLPIFNQDFDDEGNVPDTWITLRDAVKSLDGYLFVTPEYNRSIPPVLKNTLDIASRPSGKNLWGGKPGAVISVSPGSLGGFGVNHQLRQVLTCLNVYTMQQPEMYISNAAALFDEDGKLNDERTKRHILNFADSFTSWVELFYK